MLGCAMIVSLWSALQGASITWIAEDPDNDMEFSANWSPNTIPGSGDEAIFDSKIPNISLNPTDNSAPFSVLSFNFLHKASPFSFLFNNQTLTFFGSGIIGAATDTSIEINNSNNSVVLGDLLAFLGASSTSGSAEIFVSNSAGTSSSNAILGVVDSLFYSSGDFTLGNGGSLRVQNSGSTSGTHTGNNHLANTTSSQMWFDGTANTGANTFIQVNNNASAGGVNTVQSNTIATITGSQFLASDAFQANGELFIAVSNSASDIGQGIGGCQVGNIVGGDQVAFQNDLTVGESCFFDIINQASTTSTRSSGCNVGCITGDGQQFLVKGACLADNGFSIRIQNVGGDFSAGAGGNSVACIQTTSNAASQCHLDSGATIGDFGNIFILNTGFRQGSVTAAGKVSTLDKQQFYSAANFQAGSDFVLQTLNSGATQSAGQNGQVVSTVGRSQVEFETDCRLGENALFNLVNTGFNFDSTGQFNSVCVIDGCQLKVNGDFTAGENLSIFASNDATNFGNSTNNVGLVNDSQISFGQDCNLKDGSIISVSNSGTVTNDQIKFLQGFNVLSGKVFIQASNSGTLGRFGIEILGNNGGGNAEIQLANSSLSVDTTLPTFTIGGLSGDAASFAESSPILIINTDSTTLADFAGTIQDFPSQVTTIIKSGPGTQILSGVSTHTGLTTVEEGFLVLNGSIAKDLFVDTFGTLKGVGTIGGNLINSGLVSPGLSIGTLNVLGNYINNSSGFYAVEINGEGGSDLLNVTGSASLNGGTVVVTTEDGFFRFQEPYTIVTALGGVSGAYDGATSRAFIDPVLTYDLNHVYLTIESALIKAAKTCNQVSVAEVIDALTPLTPSQALLINMIANSSLEEAQIALDSLSGFQYTHDVWMTEISVRRLLRNLYNPLRTIPCSEVCTAWLETSESFTHLHGKEAHKAHADSYQITGGVQKTFSPELTFGLAGSYEFGRLKFREGHLRRYSRYVAAYGMYNACSYYGLFDLIYGQASSSLTRRPAVDGFRDKIHSKPKTDSVTFYGEAGYDLCMDSFLVQPFLGIQVGKNRRKHIEEKSLGELSLRVRQHEWSSTSSRLGIHVSSDQCYHGLDVSLDLAWNALLSSHKNRTRGRFIQFGEPFAICGNDFNRSSIDYALIFSVCLCDGWKGYVELAGEKWRHASTYEWLGGLEYSW